MSVYAPAPAFAERKPHPRTLLLIVAAHAIVIAAVMTAKMALPPRFVPPRTVVEFIPQPIVQPVKPLPKVRQATRTRPMQQQTVQPPIVQPETTTTGPIMLPNPVPQFQPIPSPLPLPQVSVPAPTGPRFATPESEVRPPYPQQKLITGEEAVLRLKLTIDAEGRVIAVEAVGNADPVFLAAARRHILAHWRYQPATQSGRPVASSTIITLQFRLDE